MALGLTIDMNANLARFEEQINRVGGNLDRFQNRAEGMSAGVNKALGALGVGLSIAAGIAGIDASLDKIIDVNREFGIIDASLRTVTGSIEGSKTAFSVLEDFAADTPYDLGQVSEAFIKLVNYGLTPSEKALTSYGNTAAAMGKNLDQMIEAVADAGSGEFERLKEFGIKAAKQGSDIQFTFRGVRTTVKDSAADIEKYLIGLGEHEFSGQMVERMKTLDGALANFGDEWDSLFLNIGKAGVGEAISSSIRFGTEEIEKLNQYISSGVLQSEITALSSPFVGLGTDISRSMDVITEIIDQSFNSWGISGASTADFLTQEFASWINNTRAFVKILTVEAASAFDLISLSSQSSMRPNTIFDDLQKQRLDAIAGILAEHDADKNKTADQIKNTEELRKKLEAIGAQSKKNAEDRLAGYKLGGKDGYVDKGAQDAADRLTKSYDQLVANMQREVVLRGDNTEAAKMEYDVIYGSLVELSEAQKLKLLNLAAEKDAINANAKALEKYKALEQQFDGPLFNLNKGIGDAMDARAQGIIPDDAKLKGVLDKMGRDYNDLTNTVSADYDRLNKKFNGPLLDLNAGIADAMDARAQGIIPDDAKLKVVLDKMGNDYNNLTNDAEAATGQMSEFAVQAARNMQSSFADFLFDPFQDGIEGMGSNFLKIIQRMAAEAASAQIFESLLGKNYGADNATGGLLSGLFSVAASAVGSYFGGGVSVSVADGNSEAFTSMMSGSNWMNVGVHHDGGLVGLSNRSMSIDPAAFNGAHRYHSGGIAGLKPNEVPIIALNDEEVLTRDDPRHRYNLQNRSSGSGSTGDISITTQVDVSGASGSENTNMKALGAVINTRIKQVIAEEKRPGGLLA